MAEKQKETNLIEVIIAVDNHTHGGKNLNKGDKISVTQERHEWLLKHKVIEA